MTLLKNKGSEEGDKERKIEKERKWTGENDNEGARKRDKSYNIRKL